jgi:hypothetical protein
VVLVPYTEEVDVPSGVSTHRQPEKMSGPALPPGVVDAGSSEFRTVRFQQSTMMPVSGVHA